MAQFDKNTGKAALSKQEAFAGVLFIAVAADGEIAEQESRGLSTIMLRMKMFQDWDDDQFNAMFAKLGKVIQNSDMQSLLGRCVQALPEPLRMTAYANAVDLVCADGVIEDNEKAYIDDLQQALDISDNNALAITKVMVIKNKG